MNKDSNTVMDENAKEPINSKSSKWKFVTKGYKGFDENLKCRGKQYAIGGVFYEPKAILCVEGLHFCENPIDCFMYYSPAKFSRYCTIEATDVAPKINDSWDTKRVCLNLAVKEEISKNDIINYGLKIIEDNAIDKKHKDDPYTYYMMNECEYFAPHDHMQIGSKFPGFSMFSGFMDVRLVSTNHHNHLLSNGVANQLISSGDFNKFAISGTRSTVVSTGDVSYIASSGNMGRIESTGASTDIAVSGDENTIASSGSNANISSSGYLNRLWATGNYSNIASSGKTNVLVGYGKCCAVASSGDFNSVEVVGNNGVGCAVGFNSVCRGSLGSFLGLVEWDKDIHGCKLKPIAAKFVKVDGKKIKPNTWYKLVNGKVVEDD